MNYEKLSLEMFRDAAQLRKQGYTAFAQILEDHASREHMEFDEVRGQVLAVPLLEQKPTALELLIKQES